MYCTISTHTKIGRARGEGEKKRGRETEKAREEERGRECEGWLIEREKENEKERVWGSLYCRRQQPKPLNGISWHRRGERESTSEQEIETIKDESFITQIDPQCQIVPIWCQCGLIQAKPLSYNQFGYP